MSEIRPALTKDELALYRIVLVRSAFSEFVRENPRIPKEKQFRLWPAQIREMNREEPRKRRFQGRDLGKSMTLMDEVNSLVLLYDGFEEGLALIGTRASLNLKPIFAKMVSMWTRNRLLSKFILPDPRRAVDLREHQIRLADGTIIQGRIQGQDGQGFNTVHPNICAWIDEAQFISDASIHQFYGMISPALPLFASGVPNGVQTSWAYKIDNDKEWGFVGKKMTRLEDPRVYNTPGGIESLARIYGGTHTNIYKHLVLGEWGAASRMTFNIDKITRDHPDDPPTAPSWWRTVVIDMADYDKSELPVQFAFRKDLNANNISDVIIHSDIGTTTPTTAYVSFYDTKENCWRQYMRFLLYGLEITEQTEVFDYVGKEIEVITERRPLIALDTTDAGGHGIASNLQRLKWNVHFCDLAEDVLADTRLENDEEIRKRIKKDPWADPNPQWIDVKYPRKQVAMQRLAREFYSGNIRIINEESDVLWAQIASTTDHESMDHRRRVYDTEYTQDGEPYDHDLQAFQVLGSALHEKSYASDKIKKQEMWVEEVKIDGWGSEPDWIDMGSQSIFGSEPIWNLNKGRYEQF